jgi:hypothetical protein
MRRVRRTLIMALSVGLLLAPAGEAWAAGPFLGRLGTVSTVASTVPAAGTGAGDVNPYGVAVVPRSTGRLHRDWVLVSNFNDAANKQGTGTTIMQIGPSGTAQVFATVDAAHLPGRCPGGVGLSTALTVLQSGWVVVGSLPTTDGSAATAKSGCLLVLDHDGVVRETISDAAINGPWDLTSVDRGDTADLYVTNVLNGTVAARGAVVNRGTVVRLRLRLTGTRAPTWSAPVVIGSGFGEHSDPAALVVGPTGLTMNHGTLYVADTVGNRIAAITHPGTRITSAGTGHGVTSGGSLNGPLGLASAPDGDVLSVNAGDGLIVETTPGGQQVATHQLDSSGSPAGSGALFGLAIRPDARAVYFVDDATNTLDLLR